VEVLRDLGHGFEPPVVFAEDELALGDLAADGEPSVSDVVVCPEQLYPLPAETEPFDDVVDL
jgi:hypothetical protein